MDHPNISHVKSYLEAAMRQDVPAMLAAFAPDLVYRVPGRGPLAGVTRGQAAALDYYQAIMTITGGTYRLVMVEGWLASAERVALIARETASRNTCTLEWTRLVLFKFHDGLISEVSLFDDLLYELDELLSGKC